MAVNAIHSARLSLKPARREDVPALEELARQCWDYFSFDPAEFGNPLSIAECLEHGSLPPGGVKENYYLYAIHAGAEIIGLFDFYRGYPTADTVYISVFFLPEAQRRQGYGREAVEALCAYFGAQGLKAVRLAVSLRNWPGIAFWHKNGFTRLTKVRLQTAETDASYGVLELERGL